MIKNEKNDKVKMVENALRLSYDYCLPKFSDAFYAYEQYKNKIDQRIWGTLSECPIPMSYAMVESMLPTIMDFLFGTPKPFALIPNSDNQDLNIEKLERYLIGKIFNEYNLKKKIKPILREALILPCSYALVEDNYITPPNVEALAVFNDEGSLSYKIHLVKGKQKKSINIRHLDFFSVFPSNFGTTPDDCDYIIVVDFIPEDEIKTAIDNGILSGDFDLMKKEARGLNSYADTALVYAKSIIDSNTGKIPSDVNKEIPEDMDIPIRIPVIKYMSRNKHIWVSGSQVIYENSGKEVLSNNIVRFCAQQIGLDWFSNSVCEFGYDMFNFINAWYNSIIDILSHYLYPVTVVNKTALNDQEQDVSYKPGLVIETTLNPQSAISFPQMPPLPPAMLQFPQEIRSLLQNVTGVSESLMGLGGVGIVRGGNSALQSLLTRASARIISIAEELEESGLKPLYEKLILKTQLIGDGQVSYINKDNERVYESVTQDEIKDVIGVQVLSKKQIENKYAEQEIKLRTLPFIVQSGVNAIDALKWVFPEGDLQELFANTAIVNKRDENIKDQLGGEQTEGQYNQINEEA